MRRMRGFPAVEPLFLDAGAAFCVAIESFPRWLVRLEGCFRHTVQDFRHELLFQLVPVVVYAGFLKLVEGLRLLDLALDHYLALDLVDLLATSAAFDLDLGLLVVRAACR